MVNVDVAIILLITETIILSIAIGLWIIVYKLNELYIIGDKLFSISCELSRANEHEKEFSKTFRDGIDSLRRSIYYAVDELEKKH